jgi:hypothetical protein
VTVTSQQPAATDAPPAPEPVKASAESRPTYAIGILAGLDFATVAFGGAVDKATTSAVGRRVALPFALSAWTPVWNSLGVQAELHFSPKGASFSSTGQSTTISARYLELPILARFDFALPISEGVGAFLLAGPYGALGISGSVENGSSSSDYAPGKQFNRWDFGAIAAAGLCYKGFSWQMRYGWGFGIANDVPNNRTRYGYEYWNRNLYVLVGYSELLQLYDKIVRG